MNDFFNDSHRDDMSKTLEIRSDNSLKRIYRVVVFFGGVRR